MVSSWLLVQLHKIGNAYSDLDFGMNVNLMMMMTQIQSSEHQQRKIWMNFYISVVSYQKHFRIGGIWILN